MGAALSCIRSAGTFVITVFLFLSSTVYAADTGLSGFNQLFFQPVSGEGLYGVHASTILPPRTFAAGMHLNLGRQLTSVVAPARAATVQIIDTNLTADLHGALGLTEFLEAGINLPVVLFQQGTNLNSLQPYRTPSFGDMRLDTKARAFVDRPRSFGLAVLSSVTVPTGDRGKFTGTAGFTWEGRLIVDKTWRAISVHTNVGYRVAPAVTVLTTDDDDRLTFGAGVQVPLGDRSWRALAEVYGETVVKHLAHASTPLEVRAGIRKTFASGFGVDLGGGAGVTNAYGVPNYRIIAGLSFNGARRRGGDTVAVHGVPGTTLYFTLGRATIRQADHEPLRTIGQHLAAHPTRRVALDGYTDASGPRRFNRALSQRRLERVCQYLGYFGADHTQCILRNHGEPSSPVRPWSPPDRRVEIRAADTLPPREQ